MECTCPCCGAAVEQASGPGQPKVYCGDACRRAGEYRLRALQRRLDKNEIELRELTFGTG